MTDINTDDFVDPADIVRDEVRQLVAAGGALTNDQAEQFALHAGRSARTMFRWAVEARNPAPEPTGNLFDRLGDLGADGFVFDDAALGLYYLCGGNMRRLRNELIAAGYDVPSEPTLSRLLRRTVPKLVRDGARTGHRNRHSSALHIRHTAAVSNQSFETDEFTLDVEVADGGNVIRPRLLLLIDDMSRFIVSWALLRSAATGSDVLALLADGFDVRPAADGTGRLIGGLPEVLTTDQGSAFRAGPVEVAFASLPATYRPAPGYTPTAKGKIERAGQHVQAEIVTGLAGRTTRLETRDGKDLMATGPETLLTFGQALTRTAEVIHRLNYETPHSALGGRTRIDAYDDGVEARRVPDEVLAGMFLVHPRADGIRIVHGDGLDVDTRYFVDECLHPHIGTKVTVRALHHRRDRVAVFSGATYIGMAYDASTLTETQRKAIVAGRRADTRSVNRHAREARAGSRKLNANLAVTGNDSIVDAYLEATDTDDDVQPARGVAPTGLNAKRPPFRGAPVPETTEAAPGDDPLRDALGLTGDTSTDGDDE